MGAGTVRKGCLKEAGGGEDLRDRKVSQAETRGNRVSKSLELGLYPPHLHPPGKAQCLTNHIPQMLSPQIQITLGLLLKLLNAVHQAHLLEQFHSLLQWFPESSPPEP